MLLHESDCWQGWSGRLQGAFRGWPAVVEPQDAPETMFVLFSQKQGAFGAPTMQVRGEQVGRRDLGKLVERPGVTLENLFDALETAKVEVSFFFPGMSVFSR